MLRAAMISWSAIDINPDLVVANLQQLSHDTLDLLSCRRRGWNLDLFETISFRLPDLLSLHISNVLIVDSHPSEEYLQGVRTFIPRFSQLQRLHINCIDYWETSTITSEMDQDFATVMQWGKDCASLHEITLPHSDGLSWYRISEKIWIPDPNHEAGERWLCDRVVSGKDPTLDALIEQFEGDHHHADLTNVHAFSDIVSCAIHLIRRLSKNHPNDQRT